MACKIIKAAYTLTNNGLLKDCGIKIRNNVIEQIAKNDELDIEKDAEIIELLDQMILPGFVNGHNHMYGFLSHGISVDAIVTEFSSFLDDFWWPYLEDRIDHDLVKVTTKWACVEMIDSGITSFVDILEAPNTLPNCLDIEKEIVTESGLRGMLSFEATERISKENGQLGLFTNKEFITKNNITDSLVTGINSIHTLFTCSNDFIQKAKLNAKETKSMIHMHLSESDYEPNWCKENFKKTPVEIYEELGFLDNTVLASQVVSVTDKELDILSKHKVNVVSMPLSNCEVGGGFAPVTKMLEKNMTVGLGTDGYINNFFEVMRGAFLIHKANEKNPQVMEAKSVYKMATGMGAKAIGFKDTGAIKCGFKADIISIDLNFPTPINEKNVYDQIVLFGNTDKITNVMVDGKWIKRNKKILTIDKEKTRIELYSMTKKFWNVN